MSKITFLGGVEEIGGNKILIETKNEKFFLDFGLSFSKFGKFYSDFLQPRVSNGIGDYLELGIIPEMNGIYRNDLLKNEGRKTFDKPEIDGVLLSHAHADHSSNIALLHKDIRIFCGETSKIILKALQETGQGTFNSDYYWYKENFVKRGKKPQHERKYHTFRTGDKLKIGNIEIEPIHVDHSIPGAYGFIIHTNDGSICYTGDLRVHGNKGFMTEEFVEKASSEEIDILLCEGTKINENEKGLTESQVFNKVKEIIKETKNLVFVNFSLKDVDRLNTFYKACVECGRELVIPTKLAYLIKEFRSDKNLQIPKLNDVKIYLHKTGWGSYEPEDYNSWERDLFNYETVNGDEVRKMQEKYVVFMDFFDLKELINIKPEHGSVYIYSTSEPHDEEQAIDFNRMKNWLEHFNLKYFTAHASGHANSEEIREIVKRINAKKVVPIHTEHPLMFKHFVKNLIIAKYGETINF
ncbi:MAG: MBL fold metallo-hydrolase [Candidatus Aenigmarchaeota archaeon]|nr:MBL fold metallo-hydrolase [Candidatus Aenigmarchaeota archaeon]